jgi:NCAIR mutase (PurE)-related protein
MIFSRKKKKPNKKELLHKKNRRTQIIMEAIRIHDKAQKKLRGKDDKEVMMGGTMNVKSMEEQDLAFALGQATTKAIDKGIGALQRLRQRGRKLKKSKSTHLNRLKKARKTLKARSRV